MAAATNEVRWISSLLRMSSLWGDILSNCSSGDELRRLPLREKPSSNCCLVRTFTNPVCILWYPSELSNSWTIYVLYIFVLFCHPFSHLDLGDHEVCWCPSHAGGVHRSCMAARPADLHSTVQDWAFDWLVFVSGLGEFVCFSQRNKKHVLRRTKHHSCNIRSTVLYLCSKKGKA